MGWARGVFAVHSAAKAEDKKKPWGTWRTRGQEKETASMRCVRRVPRGSI